MTERKRREYGAGSVYQLKDGRWRGSLETGWNANGSRRRTTVSGPTKAVVQRKLRDKAAEIAAGNHTHSPNLTVKAWADLWFPVKQAELSPNGYRALTGPIRNWVIPTIGHRRLSALTPADVRAVEQAQRDAGRKGTTAAATQRNLFNMLRAAIAEGHVVPPRVLLAKMPATSPSDRRPLTVPEALAVLKVAAELDHGTRWAVALLGGMRQGECLGLTWDSIDFERQQIVVAWQLQRLPYLDKRDRSKGFRVPHEYEARQVHKAWHLVRPKSKAGHRVVPLLPAIARALEEWREIAPANPHGLVWPTAKGTPASHQDDLAEWHALQGTAGIGHPGGRYYHVHECRNVTATELRNVGADPMVMTSLLGHTSLTTTQGYVHIDDPAKRQALELLARVLEIES